jgi:hypothetical protein
MRRIVLSAFLMLAAGSAPAAAAVIGFDSLTAAGPFTATSEAGFSVVAVSGSWVVSTGFGHPAPFIEFINPVPGPTTAEIMVTFGASPFTFASVELYSSVSTIPYVFTGLLRGSPVFTATGVVPNTFGNFATVTGPGLPIDTLRISLTNMFQSNPMGLDNLVVTPVPEPSTLALLGVVLAGVRLRSRKPA